MTYLHMHNLTSVHREGTRITYNPQLAKECKYKHTHVIL